MRRRHYRITELDAAQRYARRLRAAVSQHVRVVRSHGHVHVDVVEDERRASVPREPDRRGRAG